MGRPETKRAPQSPKLIRDESSGEECVKPHIKGTPPSDEKEETPTEYPRNKINIISLILHKKALSHRKPSCLHLNVTNTNNQI